MIKINHTHNPDTKSWVESANHKDTDFPIQNLPFAIFRRMESQEEFRGGVAIGDQVLDLKALEQLNILKGIAKQAIKLAAQSHFNNFFAQGLHSWRALRHALFDLLRQDQTSECIKTITACLIPQSQVEYTLPTIIGDYTDFYTSLDHAINCMRIMRPGTDLQTNFRWLPQAYHGRSSTIGVSGQQFRRPCGQILLPDADKPVLQPTRAMDYELELGVWIGTGNIMGENISIDKAEEHIFGVSLLNDWSARDIQMWEMAPLGPFLAKNFATTVSPWIVTLEALAPFRTQWNRPKDDPQPLSYLESIANRNQGALDIQLEVSIHTERAKKAGENAVQISRTSFKHQYWTISQMVAHHTIGGCNLKAGDLIGTGTISGPNEHEAGALIELTYGGTRPINLNDNEKRSFLQDGDTIIMRGWCEKTGATKIGFGVNAGTVLPALIL